ncbi:DUF4124 domain-containing protein [Simiduia aestuariiviva]|uniref:DUF4124 domain-containing protein n=1 Tax=Simiduia aestuariiviva TaxID=1510459 RepID=A0A839UKL7_9GAMM|nr:DUF4124 domain-containing protein [Simiduia aestuariiviva]MBB3167150.1 hypothetical protein [Simiduia aestuariiviva]
MKFLISLVLSLLLCSAAHAQIYKTTDENGRVIFTDTPSDKAESVELRETNVAPSISGHSEGDAGALPKRPAIKAAQSAYELFITSPAPNTHLTPGDRSLTVSFEASRALKPGLRYQVLSNGEPLGRSGTETSITVNEIHRGEHQISVIVFDQNQAVLAESPPVTVFVQRAKVKQPN